MLIVHFYLPQGVFLRVLSWILGFRFSHCQIEYDTCLYEVTLRSRSRWVFADEACLIRPPRASIPIQIDADWIEITDWFPIEGYRYDILGTIVSYLAGDVSYAMNCVGVIARFLRHRGKEINVRDPDGLYRELRARPSICRCVPTEGRGTESGSVLSSRTTEP